MLKASAINAARPANSALGLRRCRYGTMMYLRRDMYVGRSLDLYGEYSEGEVALFRQVLAAGDTVLDIGANIGAHTVAMAQLVGPAGSVYAFEAQRVLLQILCGNVALNEFANVHAFPSAAGRARGRIAVPALDYTRVDNFGGIAIGQGGGEEVDLVAVDELRLRQVKLIKIDVEGMELDVLQGCEDTLNRCRPLLYVENDRAQQSSSLVAHLLRKQYRLWWHMPPLFNPANFLGNPQNVFGNIVSFNIFASPRERAGEQPNLREIRSPEEATQWLTGAATATDGRLSEI